MGFGNRGASSPLQAEAVVVVVLKMKTIVEEVGVDKNEKASLSENVIAVGSTVCRSCAGSGAVG